MKIKQCGSAIYYCNKTPKLACVVTQKVDTEEPKFWDKKITLGTLSMKKLITVHDFNIPKTGEYQKQDVKCYDDFFVVDSVYRGKVAGEVFYYEAYTYDGKLIFTSKKPWNEDSGINLVKQTTKTNIDKSEKV